MSLLAPSRGAGGEGFPVSQRPRQCSDPCFYNLEVVICSYHETNRNQQDKRFLREPASSNTSKTLPQRMGTISALSPYRMIPVDSMQYSIMALDYLPRAQSTPVGSREAPTRCQLN